MGMFDWVDRPPVKCKVCGEKIDEFQTKSGFSELWRITPEQLIEDSKRLWGDYPEPAYYGYCHNSCGAWWYTYNPKTKKWEEEFLTPEELHPQGKE